MAQEIGKVEKPEAESFKQKRRVLLVPLMYTSGDSPPEYVERADLYWVQATEHITNLETKIGKIDRVYHESISLAGEDGLKIMERLNPKSYQITREKCQNGAEFEVIEDKDMAEENMDWERCRLIGFISNGVARKISELYVESARKRYEHIGKRIDETLKTDETAILFIREGHMVQFPRDIEVFSVAPPALDEIHRWVRERASAKQTVDTESESHGPADQDDETP